MYKPVTTTSVNALKTPSVYGGYSAAEPSVLYGAGSAKKAKQLQLANAGFFVCGIFVLIVGSAIFGCGVVNVVVGINDNTITGFPPGIIKTLTGILTIVNGVIIYKTSQKAVIRLARLKIMFPLTCVTLVLHLITLALAIIASFNEYMNFRSKMMASCDRDANSYAQTAANPAYSGALLDPNYNKDCAANNPNCNIGAASQLNHNFNYWFSVMQETILELYNYYKYVFRYTFVIDALHIMFALQLMAVKICLLIIIGHLKSHIGDANELADKIEPARDPTLLGSQVAMPHNRSVPAAASTLSPPAYSGATTYNPNGEPLYVNVSVVNRQAAVNPAVRSSAWSVNTTSQHAPGQVI